MRPPHEKQAAAPRTASRRRVPAASDRAPVTCGSCTSGRTGPHRRVQKPPFPGAGKGLKKKIICPDFPQPTRERVAPGPHLGRRLTVRLAVTLPPLIYGAGGYCGMGTPPMVCTHCIIEKWTYSPARARRPYWRDLARQVFALTFPRGLVTRALCRAQVLSSGSAWCRASTLNCGVGTLG